MVQPTQQIREIRLSPVLGVLQNLRSRPLLETESTKNVSLVIKGKTAEHAVVNLQQSKPSTTGVEDYEYCNKYGCRNLWAHLETSGVGITFKVFYRNRVIDMLNLGSTIPNVAKICLHCSGDPFPYRSLGGDKEVSETVH